MPLILWWKGYLFSLLLVFSSVMSCQGITLFVIIFLGYDSIYWICGLMFFSSLGKFSFMNFQNKILTPFSFLFLLAFQLYTYTFLPWPKMSLIFLSVPFFFLVVFQCGNKSVSFCKLCLPAINKLTELLISDIDFLNSRFYIWFFLADCSFLLKFSTFRIFC